MGAAAARYLGGRVREGLIIAPAGTDGAFEVLIADHPTPTAASEIAGRRALQLATRAETDDTLLLLLSGGASALMAVPAAGVTLADKARTTELLLRGGASIGALNGVRKHLSAIKGGRLAAATVSATLTLAISDVVGDDLSVIGSGPTVADPTTFAAALEVLEAHGGVAAFPEAVVSRLSSGARGELTETLKPGDARLAAGRAQVIGGRRDAMLGAADEARSRGYTVDVSDAPVVGEARAAAGGRITDAVAGSRPRPACFISSGETTVRVTGTGRGGRNQEFALAAMNVARPLAPPYAVASVGTDGVDGPTDAAGALIDSSTEHRAAERGLAATRFLDNNDAYAFFAALGDLIQTGPTGTNVGDLQVILLA